MSDFKILSGRELAALAEPSGDDCDMAAVRCVVAELQQLRTQITTARGAAKDVHERVMDMSFDPTSASRAFAVGVALRKLDDALEQREPGDGYCACGERLDKPHHHGGV